MPKPDFYIDPDISKAKTLHTDFYKSEEFFELSKEKLFSTSWQFIGHASLAAKAGNVFPFIMLEKFLDEPLVLTNNGHGNFNLLSNVCTHRGNIVVNEACSLSALRCRYHGRKFNLDGTFQSMPEFEGVKSFPSADDDLKKIPVFNWKKFLFASLGKIHKPGIFLDDMIERISWLPLEEFVFREDLSKEYAVNAHWALYCENYLEGFHIPFIHSDLNTVIDFTDYTTELFFPYSNLQIGIAKNKKDAFDLPASSPDYGKEVAAYYFWVFPNMMFNFYPWGLSINVVKPVAIDRTVINFYSYVWDESKLHTGAGIRLDKIELEDEAIILSVQKGIGSRHYTQGRYSVTRERGPHHFHSILSKFIQEL